MTLCNLEYDGANVSEESGTIFKLREVRTSIPNVEALRPSETLIIAYRLQAVITQKTCTYDAMKTSYNLWKIVFKFIIFM
jgi:hypothetical protein